MKRFWGWEPDGSPEWDAAQRAYVRALLEVEADTCPGCHGALSETTSLAAEGGYDVPPPTRCHRCTAIQSVTESESAKAYQHPRALFWTARRKLAKSRS